MKPIVAEFCPLPGPSALARAAFVFLAIGCAAAWLAVAQKFAEMRDIRTEIHRIRTEAMQRAAEAKRPTPLPPQLDAAVRVLLEQARSSWPELLSGLERVKGDGIALTSLSIDVTTQTATLELTFSSYASLLEYIENLNAAEPRLRWRLVQTRGETVSSVQLTSAGSESRATIVTRVPPK